MTKQRKSEEGGRTVNTGGGVYIEGGVTTGGDFVGGDKIVSGVGGDAKTVTEAFEKLYRAIEEMPEGPDKAIAAQAAEGLVQEATKGQRADAGAVRKWLSFLAETAPDAWQVAVDTFANPIKGLGTAFQMIMKKAEESRDAKQGD